MLRLERQSERSRRLFHRHNNLFHLLSYPKPNKKILLNHKNLRLPQAIRGSHPQMFISEDCKINQFRFVF